MPCKTITSNVDTFKNEKKNYDKVGLHTSLLNESFFSCALQLLKVCRIKNAVCVCVVHHLALKIITFLCSSILMQ